MRPSNNGNETALKRLIVATALEDYVNARKNFYMQAAGSLKPRESQSNARSHN